MRNVGQVGWAAAIVLWGCVFPAFGGDSAAEEQMERVRLSMPDVPLELEAAIRVLDGTGRPLKTVRAAAVLTPAEGGRTARYTLFDAFGSVLEEMTVALGASAPIVFTSKLDTDETRVASILLAAAAYVPISYR